MSWVVSGICYILITHQVLLLALVLASSSLRERSPYHDNLLKETIRIENLSDNKVFSIRAPEARIGGKNDVIINLENNDGIKDAGFRCHAYDLRPALNEDVHVVKIKPVVSALSDLADVVHHMDIFTCQQKIETSFPADWSKRNDWCAMEEFISKEKSCIQMIWAYDRGALTYKFPSDTGIRLGPSVGFTHLLLQIHYLLPKGYVVGQGDGFLDSSGFDIYTGKPRNVDSHLFGFLDQGLLLPPKKSKYKFSVHLSSMDLAKLVGPDLAHFGEIQPFAVHLHAHDHGKALWLEHFRDGTKIGEYASIDPFHGYGADQTFIHVPKNAPPLRPGDSLTFHCIFDTRDTSHAINYGVSHGDEMCAPLVLYYPHVKDHATNNVQVWDEHIYKKDASPEQVHEFLKEKFGKFEYRHHG